MVFFFVLANGYFILFFSKTKILAVFIGVILAALAWNLAKFIGSSKEGIKGNIPFFVLLLILSAIGVFNSLMVNLEGKHIYQETIDGAAGRFKDLTQIAKSLENPKLEAKRLKVNGLKHMFIEELRNPNNCGQGRDAKKLAKEIKDELPLFQVLSGSAGCKDIEKVIASYDASIDKLLLNSSEFMNADYPKILAMQNNVSKKEIEAQVKLIKLQKEISDGGGLIIQAKSELEEINRIYRDLAHQLNLFIPNDKKFPTELEINSVRNLGEWSQVINLLISRLDNLSTYVYLFLAIFADVILIYSFSRLSNLRKALPNQKTNSSETEISTIWKNE